MVDRDRSDGLSLFPDERAASTGSVECLGMIFESDKARRAALLSGGSLAKLGEVIKRLDKYVDDGDKARALMEFNSYWSRTWKA